MDLQNKVALITGGARMGQAIGRALAEHGTHLALTYRTSRNSAEQSASHARSLRLEALTIEADLAKNEDCAKVISQIRKKFKRLDCLIHLASIYESVPSGRTSPSHWDRHLSVHLKAAYALALRSAPLMRKNGGGRMIFSSDWTSASGRPRYKNLLPYYVSKHALLGLVEGLALELAPDILVNAVAPGPILPPTGLSAKDENEVVRSTPLGKWGGADEIAKAVLFLMETDFVTGECIRVDGGRHLY